MAAGYRHLFTTGLVLLLTFSLQAQTTNTKSAMSNPVQKSNPLLCEPTTGACEMPGQGGAAAAVSPGIAKPLRILYFTDPICSSCWGIEAQLRKLGVDYGHLFDIEYHMGGLLPSWEVYNSGGISKPSDVAHHWDEVSAYYEMPIDGDVWLEDPLPSSYPPSVAFKAAQLQDPLLALRFLRRIREMVFLEKKNIAKIEYLRSAAAEVGLDPDRLEQDMAGKAQQLFQEDLQLTRSMGVRGFPTLFFADGSQPQGVLYGARAYAQFEQQILRLLPGAIKQDARYKAETWFLPFPTLTTKEYALLTGLPMQQAGEALKQLQQQGKIQRFDTKNGPIWKAGKP